MHAIKRHAYIYTHKLIRVIGKTDLIRYNKKINFNVKSKLRVILLEEICFPSAISLFSKCFAIKHSRNLFGSKYDSTMVSFISYTDTRQISAAPNSRRNLIFLVSFCKMMSFETNGLRFLVRNRAAFCLLHILPQMQCGMVTIHYHSTTARYGLRNDLILPKLIF